MSSIWNKIRPQPGFQTPLEAQRARKRGRTLQMVGPAQTAAGATVSIFFQCPPGFITCLRTAGVSLTSHAGAGAEQLSLRMFAPAVIGGGGANLDNLLFQTACPMQAAAAGIASWFDSGFTVVDGSFAPLPAPVQTANIPAELWTREPIEIRFSMGAGAGAYVIASSRACFEIRSEDSYY